MILKTTAIACGFQFPRPRSPKPLTPSALEQTGDKTQDATPHRRQQAREEGRVAQSQDLAASLILLVGLSAIMMMGGRLADFMANLAQRQLGDGAWLSTDVGVFCHQTRDVLTGLGLALMPVFGVVWLAAVVRRYLVQIGFVVAPESSNPDLDAARSHARISAALFTRQCRPAGDGNHQDFDRDGRGGLGFVRAAKRNPGRGGS